MECQKFVDQSAHAAKNLSDFTDASISAFLLSPLLVRAGQRPLLIKTASERRTPLCASAAVKALGGAAALSVPVSGAVFRPAPGTAKRPTPFLSTIVYLSFADTAQFTFTGSAVSCLTIRI